MVSSKPSRKGSSRAASAAKSTAVIPPAPGTLGAYQAGLEKAQALSANEPIEFHGDPNLAAHNMRTALQVVTPVLTNIESRFTEDEITQFHAIPELIDGFAYAARQVFRAYSDGTIAKLFPQVCHWRKVMLTSADVLVLHELLPRAPVDQIHKGKGKVDATQDTIDLCALFTKSWTKVSAKVVFTTSDVESADTTARQLLQILKPTRGNKRQSAGDKATNEARETRDRFYTLLDRAHDLLFKMATAQYGREAMVRIPALQAHAVVQPRKPKEKPSTSPTPPAPATGSAAHGTTPS